MAWRDRIVRRGVASPKALIANPANWRKHGELQRTSLAAVLDRVGWVQDIIVNVRTGNMVDGHMRVTMALERGEGEVPVAYVDLDEEEERLILATFDPIGALAGTDDEAILALLEGIEADDETVQQLLRTVAAATGVAFDQPQTGLADPDEIPAIPPKAVSQVGDLWRLGEHRVLCGDATASDDVARLFGADHAAWLWTDPPYGVEYEGRTRDKLRIANDVAVDIPALLADTFGNANAVLEPGAPVYCAAPAGRQFLVFGRAFEDVGWHLHESLVWVKDSMVLGHSDYHYRHELILYGWKGTGRRWVAGRKESSVFEVPRPQASPDHPTSKPVALVEAHIQNSSLRGGIGYDPFLGSGTTLVASERLGRHCFGIDVEPRYVDVAIRRWEQFTGRAAVLLDDGRTFGEIASARHVR